MDHVTMLLDVLMPAYDATRIEHRVIDAPVDAVYAAALAVDLVEVGSRHGLVRGLFALREAGEHVVEALRGTSGSAPPPMPGPLRLGDLTEQGEWVRLAADPPRELAFGAIGRFWGGETAWLQTDAAAFAGYAEPGVARIAANLSLRPYGTARTLLSYEARTQATDEASRAAFLRYWRVVSPGVGIVLRATLAHIGRAADPGSAP